MRDARACGPGRRGGPAPARRSLPAVTGEHYTGSHWLGLRGLPAHRKGALGDAT
ncbi:MAG: hypothetical protein MZV63_06585 [Marinilabiliales bacterium]|nr:hypothetical protein [Marinilabiliales bacterium]